MSVRELALGVALLLSVSPVLAQKPAASGTYQDRGGASHTWSVGAGHALLWDGQPYVPVGGTFTPRYLAQGATEPNWAADVKALDALKAKGILDLIIDPMVSATDVSAAAWQRVIDKLEEAGFRYGIAFGTGVKTPLTGYVVRPQTYRIAGVREGTDVVWDAPDADTARYIVVDATDGSRVLKDGQVRVRDGTASAPTGDVVVSGGAVGLLYPHRTIRPAREGWMPDLWAGFDGYRDTLIGLLGQVKFGPGLRFFLDPLARPLGLLGDADYLVPDSLGFRVEWEAYLRRKYPTADAVQQGWALSAAEVRDFRALTGLVPMWETRSGAPFMMDPANGHRYQLGAGIPRFWDDLREFETQSFSYYMNAMADLLKREVANVPVVYTRTLQHRMFSQSSATSGFDGLGISAYGKGSSLVTAGADSTYSQCEDAAKVLWCVVSETMDTSSPKKATPGYASREALFFDLDWLRGIGARGFFVWGLQVLPEDRLAAFQMAAMPEQLDWLKAYAERGTNAGAAGARPRTVPFPMAAAGLVHPGPVGNTSVVWVPSLAPGRAIGFGSSYAGYVIGQPEGEVLVLWSLRGPRETRLSVADPRKLDITTIDGVPVQFRADVKRKWATVMLDDTPRLIRAGAIDLVPVESVEDGVKQLRNLVAHALDQSLPALDFRLALDRIEQAVKRGNYALASSMLQDAISGIVLLAQPYTWREAEIADSHSFTEVARIPGASNGSALVLNASTKTHVDGFVANYKLVAPADGDYTFWVACTPPGPQASPFQWTIDGGSTRLSTEGALVGATYVGDRFGWMNLGHSRLTKGAHTLAFRVNDPAPGLDRYALAIDAILLTRDAFTPRGTLRPTLSEEAVKIPSKVLPPKK